MFSTKDYSHQIEPDKELVIRNFSVKFEGFDIGYEAFKKNKTYVEFCQKIAETQNPLIEDIPIREKLGQTSGMQKDLFSKDVAAVFLRMLHSHLNSHNWLKNMLNPLHLLYCLQNERYYEEMFFSKQGMETLTTMTQDFASNELIGISEYHTHRVFYSPKELFDLLKLASQGNIYINDTKGLGNYKLASVSQNLLFSESTLQSYKDHRLQNELETLSKEIKTYKGYTVKGVKMEYLIFCLLTSEEDCCLVYSDMGWFCTKASNAQKYAEQGVFILNISQIFAPFRRGEVLKIEQALKKSVEQTDKKSQIKQGEISIKDISRSDKAFDEVLKCLGVLDGKGKMVAELSYQGGKFHKGEIKFDIAKEHIPNEGMQTIKKKLNEYVDGNGKVTLEEHNHINAKVIGSKRFGTK